MTDRASYATKILEAMSMETDVETKRLEVTAIAKLGESAALPLLEKLKSASGEYRLNIIRALGDLGDEAKEPVIEALLPYLGEKDKILQRQVVGALGKLGSRAARAEDVMVGLLPKKVSGLLDDPEAYILSLATIISLGKIGAKKDDSIHALKRYFELIDPKGNNPQVDALLKEVLIAFGNIGTPAGWAAPRILEVTREVSNPILLEEAAIALAKTGSSLEIEKLARSELPGRKLAALVGLTAVKVPEDRKKILDLLLPPKGDNFLAPSAINSLKKRGKGAIPVLADALDIVKNTFVKENLVIALGELGKDSEPAAQAMISVLKDNTYPYAQIAAIRNLEDFGLKNRKDAKDELRFLAVNSATKDLVRPHARRAVFASIAADKVYSGTLTTSGLDEKLQKHVVRYPFRFEKGFLYQVDLASRDFDAFLYVKKGDNVLAFDDDGGGNLNARVFFESEPTEEYEIWASTYSRNSLGSFTLEIRKLAKEQK